MILGSVTALKDDLIVEFNNIIGTISFFIQYLDKIDLVEEDLSRIVGDLNLGKIDYIELSLEMILNGKLNLNINMLGGKVVGMKVSSERKNVRINYYIAMANSYSVLITYKLKI
jgi:hypothetical protein